jgi:glycosyl transferase family 25
MAIPQSTIQFLESYFDRIFVITIPRLTQRHQIVKEHLKGLHYQLFYGADKNDITQDFIAHNYNDKKAIALQRYGLGLNKGEIACSLSHRMVYEEIIEKKLERVLVFEDDVIPLSQTIADLPNAINELPENWELFYAGYLGNEVITPTLKRKQLFYKIISTFGLMKWNRKMVTNLLPKPYSAHLKKAGFHNCSHAYALTLTAAVKFMNTQSPVVYRADDVLSYTSMQGIVDAFIATPKFFDQESIHNPSIKSEIKE